ncbi:hypothetical protein FC695_44905, partial [Bacillus cereus]
ISGITFINELVGFISLHKQYETSAVFKTIDGGASWQPIKDIPSLEGSNNETSMAYKAIYKNNLLVIPTKMNNDVFLMNYSFDKG